MIQMLIQFKLFRGSAVRRYFVLQNCFGPLHLTWFLVVDLRLDLVMILKSLKKIFLIDELQIGYNLLGLLQCVIILL